LIRKMLVVNPQERITAKQALKHDWFRTKSSNKKMHKEFKTELSRHNSKRKSMVRHAFPPSHCRNCFFSLLCTVLMQLFFALADPSGSPKVGGGNDVDSHEKREVIQEVISLSPSISRLLPAREGAVLCIFIWPLLVD
jgi:serine/threonine protein kinase